MNTNCWIKEVGDSVVLPLRQSELRDTFGHLDVPLFRQIDEEGFVLKSTVDKVEKATDREIVKAVAMAGGDGCGLRVRLRRMTDARRIASRYDFTGGANVPPFFYPMTRGEP